MLYSEMIQASQGLGTHQRRVLTFIRRVNGWHSYARDVAHVVESLERRGLVETSNGAQFRAALHVPHWARVLPDSDLRYCASQDINAQFFPMA
jgi:hypothetical protein